MRKEDAYNLCDFIQAHYDMVGQEDWFELCETLLTIVLEDANKSGSSNWDLAQKYPIFFTSKATAN